MREFAEENEEFYIYNFSNHLLDKAYHRAIRRNMDGDYIHLLKNEINRRTEKRAKSIHSIDQNHLEELIMQEAYGILYKLEKNLRKHIEKTMQKEYGQGWWTKAPLENKYPPYKKHFNNFYLHETISLLSAYPCLSIQFSKEVFAQLVSIVPIRNKVAHMKFITLEDYELLLEIEAVIKQIINKNN